LLMVTGIANPRLFKRRLRGISTHITEINFPDHHAFSLRDLARITQVFKDMEGEEKFLFTTEKDAVRLRKFTEIESPMRERMYYVPVGIDFLNEDRENFNNHIRSYVRDNKRNSILHKRKD
jgi:tetraacyldisaccharide 4'-kinase